MHSVLSKINGLETGLVVQGKQKINLKPFLLGTCLSLYLMPLVLDFQRISEPHLPFFKVYMYIFIHIHTFSKVSFERKIS